MPIARLLLPPKFLLAENIFPAACNRQEASGIKWANNKSNNRMESPFLVPIVLFIAIGVVLYVFIQARHRERMAMIEKGYDASLLHSDVRSRTGKFGALKVGIVAIGVGIGLLVGSILEATTTLDGDVAYFSMISLFGGIGLIVYYLLVREKEA